MKLSRLKWRNVRGQTKSERLNRTEAEAVAKQQKREQRKQQNLARFNKTGKKGRCW